MPSISDKQIYDLLDLIYETTIETSSESWLHVYKEMAKVFSSGPGGLSFYHKDKNSYSFAASTLNEEIIQQYNDYYQTVSPFRRKIDKMNAGERFCRSKHLSDESFFNTEIYQEYFKRQDVFHYDYEVLFKEANVSGGISFTRPYGMANFNEQEYEAMNLIVPHVRRAFRVFYYINQNRKDKQIMEEVLNRIPQSVIVVNKSRKVIYINDNAQKLINKKDGLQINRKGNLVANLSQDTRKLMTLIHNTFHPKLKKQKDCGGTVQLSRPSGLRQFSVLISPMKNQPIFSSRTESFAIVFITDPEQKVETIEQVLCDIYSFTPAESKLAAILTQGKSPKEACNLLKVKDNTVRTHLKHIFSKTDTHRQSDLVRLILTGPANIKGIE